MKFKYLQGMEHKLASIIKIINFTSEKSEILASKKILHAKRDLDGTLFDNLIRTFKKLQALNNSKSEGKTNV